MVLLFPYYYHSFLIPQCILICLFFVALLPLASSFVHPGLLVTDSDITRAQQKIKANADP